MTAVQGSNESALLAARHGPGFGLLAQRAGALGAAQDLAALGVPAVAHDDAVGRAGREALDALVEDVAAGASGGLLPDAELRDVDALEVVDPGLALLQLEV